MRRVKRLPVLFAAGALALFAAAAAPAQQITCIQPANCILEAATKTAPQYLTVRVVGGAPGTMVRFRRTEGAGIVTDSLLTDVNGLVTTMWVPAPQNPYPAKIEVTARTGTGNGTQTLQITHTPSTALTVHEPANSGNYQWWFEDRQLLNKVRVEIRGAATQPACEAAAVAFRTVGGGTTAPDSVNGSWHHGEPQPCVAESWWRLPKGVGTHALRANLAGEPTKNLTFYAQARALPRIIVGVAAHTTHSFSALESVDTIEVKRELPGTNTTITYDSVTSKVKTDRTEPFNPTIGVDFPLWPSLQRVRASLMTTMTHPDENLFLGVSLIQLYRGLGQEAVGFDFHLSLHVQRVKTLRDPDACTSDPTNSTQCGNHHVFRYGIALLGVTDTRDVVTTLGSVFGIK